MPPSPRRGASSVGANTFWTATGGTFSPRPRTRTPSWPHIPGASTPNGTSAGTEGPSEETKARYAFVYGDFRRLHRSGLIACHYRAAEWRHKEIELAAHELLQLLDKASG